MKMFGIVAVAIFASGATASAQTLEELRNDGRNPFRFR